MQEQINAFLDFVYQSRSSKTYAMYKIALSDFLSAVGEAAPLTQQTYAKYLRQRSTMSPATQSLYRSAIRGLYLFAADSDPSIPTAFFEQTNKRLAKRVKNAPVLFNREGIEKILTHCSAIRNGITDLRDRAFIFLLADSGLRVSEACSLRIGYVDLLECQAVVTGKGNKPAVVKLSNRTAEALCDYLKERKYTSKATPLFIRHSKKAGDHIQQVTAGDMWHSVKQRATEAGIDPATIRVHDFRHYFVTVILASSGNIKLAQELARHERVETTGRYAHFLGNSDQAYDEIFNQSSDTHDKSS